MALDLARELAVRSIAHNLANRFSADADEDDVLDYAERLARMMSVAAPASIADAGVVLWRAITHGEELEPIHVHAEREDNADGF